MVQGPGLQTGQVTGEGRSNQLAVGGLIISHQAEVTGRTGRGQRHVHRV